MRRIKLVLAALVVMVAAFAAFAGPAMAADRDDNWNNGYWNNNYWNNGYWNNNYWNNGYWNWWNNVSNTGFICFDNGTASGCIPVT